jgi:hypothetical protein
LASIRRLYAVEADAKERKLDDDARRTLRQQLSLPILGELFAWLEGVRAQVLPKSPMGEAIGYALNHKAALLRYTEHGFLEIDNNASERGEKTIALGRNYADLQIMRSWCRDGRDMQTNPLGATPHNSVTGCRGIRAAFP